MGKIVEFSVAKLLLVIGGVMIFGLVIYNNAFDRTGESASISSQEVLEQISEDPKFIEYFGEGLATFAKLDTDKDGTPDVSDSDIDNDGIPNEQDNDVDGDGTPNNEDPSSAMVNLTGQVGLKGDKGDEGDLGNSGESGNNGQDGSTGSEGNDGDNGTAGSTGDDGATGNTGDEGNDGSDGSTGTAGSQGPKGDTGIQGVTGAQGLAGAQGTTGLTGAQGATGTVGVVTDDGVIDTTLTGSDLDIQLLLAAGSGLAKTGTGLSLDTSCANSEVLKWNGATWACASDDGGITYSAGTGINIAVGVISSVLGTDINSSEIVNGTITSADIAADTLTAADLATSSVESDEILNGTIATADLGNSQVTKAKVADDTLNFDVFSDMLTIDAMTAVGTTDSEYLELTRATEGRFLSFSDGTDTHSYMAGSGTPEATHSADTGSLYVDTTSAALYMKTTDTVNTGWSQIGGPMDFASLSDTDVTGVAAGSVLYYDGTNWVDLPAGTAGQKLAMNTGATAPEWVTDSSSSITLNYLAAYQSDDFSGSGLVPFEAADVTANVGVTLDDANDRFDITQTGLYEIIANASIRADHSGNQADSDIQLIHNVATTNTVLVTSNVSTIEVDGQGSRSGDAAGMSAIVSLTAGDTISLNNVSNNQALRDVNITIKELPTKTVVAAGDLEVTGGDGTNGQVLASNADGTASFVTSASSNTLSGTEAGAAGIRTVTFATAFASAPAVTANTVMPIGNLRFVQIISISNTGFVFKTVDGSQVGVSEPISWIASGQ